MKARFKFYKQPDGNWYGLVKKDGVLYNSREGAFFWALGVFSFKNVYKALFRQPKEPHK